MDFRAIGGTGVKVSHLRLGAMMFGAWGNPDHAECVRIIRTALDGGVNLVDTTDACSHGGSEEIVGKARKGRRDRVVLATKFHAGKVRYIGSSTFPASAIVEAQWAAERRDRRRT